MIKRRLIFNKGIGIVCLLTLFLFSPAPANAQTEIPPVDSPPVVAIHSLDTSQFPTVTFKADVRAEDGSFVSNLEAADLEIIENGRELAAESLSITRAKAQIVVALNPAMVMVNQYEKSNVLQKIQQALQDWLKKQPAGKLDDLNLAVNDGMLALHLSQPADMIKVIETYQPNLYTVQTNLNSFNTALEMSTDPNIPSEVKKELLYISPAPAPEILTSLPSLIERAKKAGVRIDVWLVSASPVVEARGAAGLKQLAEATGGEYFIFTGREALPDPDVYLNAIRGQYQVTYQSRLTRPGEQNLSLRVTQADGQLESNALSFTFDVQPPNPILLNPPLSITLPVEAANASNADQGGFNQLIRVLIEFPDGHSRSLKRVQLYVNGQLVAENTAAPYDEFFWEIPEAAADQRHFLQVKVEDMLGLTRTSAASPVDVLENPASRTLLEQIASSERLLTASAIAAAILAILILLWLSSRRSRFKFAHANSNQAAAPGQVTRPVRPSETEAMKQAGSRLSAASQAPTVPLKFRAAPPQPGQKFAPVKPAREAQVETSAAKRQVSFSKPACLIRLDQANKPIPGGEFLVTRAEITIGSSPGKSILVIDLPSVDGLHARLVRTLDDNYFLADCGSVGGTWVNFAPVSSRGVHLVDGDLIHFGRTPFRFELGKPDDPLIRGKSSDKKI